METIASSWALAKPGPMGSCTHAASSSMPLMAAEMLDFCVESLVYGRLRG
jgi:hypothetical protein